LLHLGEILGVDGFGKHAASPQNQNGQNPPGASACKTAKLKKDDKTAID
jgi:hypothetical protein